MPSGIEDEQRGEKKEQAREQIGTEVNAPAVSAAGMFAVWKYLDAYVSRACSATCFRRP